MQEHRPEPKISDISPLLAEYEANVSLWQHDDSLRQQRNGNFLTVNTALLVALGALAGLHVPSAYLGVIAVAFAVFGVLICRVWHIVQVRNAEYVRFRRHQLRSIEARLPGLTTFRNTYRAFYEGSEVQFLGTADRFALDARARQRSTVSEGRLPLLIGFFWGVVSLVGVAIVFTSFWRGA